VPIHVAQRSLMWLTSPHVEDPRPAISFHFEPPRTSFEMKASTVQRPKQVPGKVTAICHLPPPSPQRCHTMPRSAWQRHLRVPAASGPSMASRRLCASCLAAGPCSGRPRPVKDRDSDWRLHRRQSPRRSGGMADAPDSKSGPRKWVRVQVPPSAVRTCDDWKRSEKHLTFQ
jgi:hypothetical protein